MEEKSAGGKPRKAVSRFRYSQGGRVKNRSPSKPRLPLFTFRSRKNSARQQDGGRAFLQIPAQKVVEHHGHAHKVQDAEVDDLSPHHGPQLHRDPRRQYDDAPAQVAAGEPGRGPGQEDEAAAGEFLHHVQGRGEELLPADDAEEGQIVEKVVRRHQRQGQGPPAVQNVKPPAHYTLKRNRMMSPSFTTYSLPSERMRPFSRAAAMDPAAMRSS